MDFIDSGGCEAAGRSIAPDVCRSRGDGWREEPLVTADRTNKPADGRTAKDGARPEERRMRREAISAELRQAYAEILREPVPDSFRALLGEVSPPTLPGKRRS